MDTTADTETPEQTARRVADYLFRNGNGDEADRLMLVSEKAPWSREAPRDLGGWSRAAIRDILATAITNAVAVERERCAKIAEAHNDAHIGKYEYQNCGLKIASLIRQVGDANA